MVMSKPVIWYWMNNVDPDEISQSMTSDKGLHCFTRTEIQHALYFVSYECVPLKQHGPLGGRSQNWLEMKMQCSQLFAC